MAVYTEEILVTRCKHHVDNDVVPNILGREPGAYSIVISGLNGDDRVLVEIYGPLAQEMITSLAEMAANYGGGDVKQYLDTYHTRKHTIIGFEQMRTRDNRKYYSFSCVAKTT
jgi:hypothetical protein